VATWREQVEICDPWAFYDYKKAFSNKSGASPSWLSPSWIPEDDQRRLLAYHLLDDLCKNRGRNWMDPEIEDDKRQDHREYGDPGMVVAAVQSSVVGDSQTIMVEGMTEEGDAGGDRTTQFELLNEWMAKERFLIKLMTNETKCSKLGDMVYVLGIDEVTNRPRVRCWDPSFYFPVLDDWANEEDFPKTVYIAWEYEKKVNGKDRKFLRRMTWQIVDTADPRDYPWNTAPVNRTCMFEELEWDIENITDTGLVDLSRGAAVEIRPLTDMEIDFLPVVHIPNFPAEDEHWGTSSLALAMQLFDDLSSTDTDLQAASATTGSPPLGVEDASIQPNSDGEIETWGPGQVFGGKVSVVDTSRSLDALLKLKEALQERVEVNLRVPKTLIGRVDPSKVESGIILTLSFQPHSNMIRQMRLVRQDKYDLLLKFVCRFYVQLGGLAVVHPCHLKFGSYLPADRSEVGEIVREGITAHSMSIETAVALMVEAGYPIDDAKLEATLIVQQNYEAASKALDASGDVNFSRELLGLPPVDLEDLGLEATNPEEPPTNVPPGLPLPQ
jgi:hypothetical protein